MRMACLLEVPACCAGLLILSVTLLTVIASVVGVVSLGVHRLEQARKAADESWQKPPEEAALASSTRPAIDTINASEMEEPIPPKIGSIELWAKDATLHGLVTLVDRSLLKKPQAETTDSKSEKHRIRVLMGGHSVTTHLAGFRTASDYAEWTVDLPKEGEYEIDLTYACPKWTQGGKFTLKVGDKSLPLVAEPTRYETSFRVMTIGKLTLPAGKTTVTLQPEGLTVKEHHYMNLRSVQLIPMS